MRKFILMFVCVLLPMGVMAANKHIDPVATKVSFSAKLPKTDNLVLGVYSNGKLGKLAKSIDGASDGSLAHAIKVMNFEAKAESAKLIPAPKGSGFKQILLVGLGEQGKSLTALEWQNIGGHAIQKSMDTFKSSATMAFDVDAKALANIAFGAKIGGYYFDKYFTDGKEEHQHPQKLVFVSGDAKAANKYYQSELASVADGVIYTRNVSNEPANVIYPQAFVDVWKQHLKGLDNVKIKVIDDKEMQEKGMGAIYGVGKGSERKPRMMIVEYNGGRKGDAPIAFVGKGITFDTGGISLKSPNKMWNMKFDMSGAASVMGAVYALAGRDAKVNIVAVAALAENMPSQNAQRPGDVVKSMSGKTIQIRSTDAEGRLVLADALYYADTVYDPKLIVDLATLTGSASRALGKDYAALFVREDKQNLVPMMLESGINSGDKVWQMPLNDNHFKAIENEIADVMNSGPDAPGASAGAAFLGTFVRESTNWVHLDIAGVAYNSKVSASKVSPGSTSFGVRLLNELIKTQYEK